MRMFHIGFIMVYIKRLNLDASNMKVILMTTFKRRNAYKIIL